MNTIYDAGLDLPRIWDFIQRTKEVGGTVAKMTLATANWVRLFATDEDAQFLIQGCAYGFTWPAESPTEFYEIDNYVTPAHEHKGTERVAEELASGQIVPTTRDKVHGIAAIGVVDKQRSG